MLVLPRFMRLCRKSPESLPFSFIWFHSRTPWSCLGYLTISFDSLCLSKRCGAIPRGSPKIKTWVQQNKQTKKMYSIVIQADVPFFQFFLTCGGSKGRGSANVSLKLQPCAQILWSGLIVLFSVLLGIEGDKRLVLSDNGSSNLSLVRLALEHRDRAEVQPLSWGKTDSYLSCFNISLLTSLLTLAFVLVLGQDQWNNDNCLKNT